MKIPLGLFLVIGSLTVLLPAAVEAADIRVLCTNSLQGPLAGVADAFSRQNGHRVEFVFGSAPQLIKRLIDGEAADVVIFTPRSFENAVKTGKVIGESRTEIGRISVGIMVRTGTVAPEISTPESLKKALLEADSLVFNQRTSGVHFARVLERLGIAGEVKSKSRRPEFDVGVFEEIHNGKGKDLGVTTLPAIMADGGKTVRLVGPLPAELQSYESFIAGLTANARSPAAAKALIAFLTSAQTKATLAKRGVD